MKNKLIAIGWMGCITCYLNVPREEAIRRYLAENLIDGKDLVENYIHEFEFDDMFGAYSVWEQTPTASAKEPE